MDGAEAAVSPTCAAPVWNWRLFWTLEIAGVFAVTALLPYAFSLQQAMLKQHPMPTPPPPPPVLIALQIFQNSVLIGGFVGLGMWLAPKVGLGTPLLSALTTNRHIERPLLIALLVAASLGVGVALLVILLDKWVFVPRLPLIAHLEVNVPAWKGFLASFYGGIDEEIFLRFGVMTLLVAGLARIFRTGGGRPAGIAFWLAIISSAVLFGLGHLPATAGLMPITSLVVYRAVLLNGILGIVFGVLYWKRGLEFAMVSHFAADLVLHLVAPLFLARIG